MLAWLLIAKRKQNHTLGLECLWSSEIPMDETPRENWATWIGLFATIIPGMIVSGFMPEWNVLPYAGWFAIAAIGSAMAGAIATPRLVRGAISGVIAGVGMMFGLWLYVVLRSSLTGNHTFFKIELVIGGMLGAAPGLVLYGAWARKTHNDKNEVRLARRVPARIRHLFWMCYCFGVFGEAKLGPGKNLLFTSKPRSRVSTMN